MYKRKTATYKKLAHHGKANRSRLFSSNPIVSFQMKIQMVNDGGERERARSQCPY